jgi:hypothetical protein
MQIKAVDSQGQKARLAVVEPPRRVDRHKPVVVEVPRATYSVVR